MRGSPLARRAGICLDELQSSCSGPIWRTDRYWDFPGLLVVYGAGAPDRREAVKRHRGNWVAFDLGYWNRVDSFRVSVNSEHPTPEQMRDFGARPYPAALREDSDPKGHIVLVGMGRKSRIWWPDYERIKLEAIRKVYPKHRIVFRPKPGSEPPPGIDCDHWTGGDIEDVLRGASLVVCRHSNVAVDACIAGIPVVCEGGAAAAIYGDDLKAPRSVCREDRLRFLQRLAWWQWSSQQIRQGEFWPWLETALYGSM
jgi:hypothetical protein